MNCTYSAAQSLACCLLMASSFAHLQDATSGGLPSCLGIVSLVIRVNMTCDAHLLRQLPVLPSCGRSYVSHAESCGHVIEIKNFFVVRIPWAARYNIWLLIQLTPRGVAFPSLPFPSLPFPSLPCAHRWPEALLQEMAAGIHCRHTLQACTCAAEVTSRPHSSPESATHSGHSHAVSGEPGITLGFSLQLMPKGVLVSFLL